MPIVCRGLEEYGVTLVPPSAPEYPQLVQDVLRRMRARPQGGPPVHNENFAAEPERLQNAAVLSNQAGKAIVSVAYVWEVRLLDWDSRIVTHSYSPGTNPSLILPFGWDESVKDVHRYWSTIFSGSKRILPFGGPMLGDNTDVRPPGPKEIWHGGFISFGGFDPPDERKEPVSLSLDGVFFEDGGFAGPDQLGTWEQTVASAQAHLEMAELARKAKVSGLSAEDFALQVRRLTRQPESGRLPAPPPPPFPGLAQDLGQLRKYEQEMVGYRVLQLLKRRSERTPIDYIAEWPDLSIPDFRKL
jgi:hypothetical protein